MAKDNPNLPWDQFERLSAPEKIAYLTRFIKALKAAESGTAEGMPDQLADQQGGSDFTKPKALD